MKELFIPLFFIIFIVTACENRTTRKKQIEQTYNSPNTLSYNIEINMKNRIGLDIDSIYAVILTPATKNNRLILARSAYNDSSVTLSLPSYLDTVHLINAYNALLSDYDKDRDEITFSDKNAKISLPIRFEAFKSNKFIGSFTYNDSTYKGISEGQFRYLNKTLAIQGGYSQPPNYLCHFDINLKEGWNMIYKYFQYETLPIEHGLVNNAPLDTKWYFHSKG